MEKQFIINSFTLPDVLNDLIKDFLFYDKVTSARRAVKRELILHLERTMYMSEFEYENKCEWILWTSDVTVGGVMCLACGNFDSMIHNGSYAPRVHCYCGLPALIE